MVKGNVGLKNILVKLFIHWSHIQQHKNHEQTFAESEKKSQKSPEYREHRADTKHFALNIAFI